MNHRLRLVGMFSVLAMLVFLPGSSPIFLGQVRGDPMIMVNARNSNVQSSNWGGYAVTAAAGQVSDVVASWTVPSVACGPSETSYSSYWVGIDGFTSKTVEQIGTDSDCRTGVPTYYAWFEFFPLPSRAIGSIVVSPGDVIEASVTFTARRIGGGFFTDAIKDVTTGQSFSASSMVFGAQRSSAEFIVESPAICSILRCRLASLPNFGTVGFGQDNTGVTSVINCAATISGVSGSIGSFGSAVQQITMVSQSNPPMIKAQPSALSEDGTSFTAQWMSAGP